MRVIVDVKYNTSKVIPRKVIEEYGVETTNNDKEKDIHHSYEIEVSDELFEKYYNSDSHDVIWGAVDDFVLNNLISWEFKIKDSE